MLKASSESEDPLNYRLAPKVLCAVASLAVALSARFVDAQMTDIDWNTRLVARPLYLRGFWHGDQLRFDPSGKLKIQSEPGPVTLSGVEVKSATIQSGLLVIRANRVALVRRADQQPGLERVPISSTTHISFSLRRGDKQNYHAPEEMKIVVEPDAAGNFDAAVEKIFVDGLENLTAAVPSYWKCYATSYFAPTIAPDAEETVERCVATPGSEVAGADGRDDAHAVQAPVLIGSGKPASLGEAPGPAVHGDSVIHLRVTAEGNPVGLQVIQALGAGADEASLQAVSTYRFKPAMRDGVAMPVDMNVSVSFR